VPKPEWNPGAKVVATGLFSTAEHTRLHYVLQGETVLLNVLLSGSRELGPAEIELLDAGYPGYRECVTQAMRENRVSVFFDPRRWKAFLAKGFLFAIGTRLHGAIMALNAGIPALVTNGDMRAKEVTDYFRIPLLPAICGLDFELRKLYDQLDIDSMNGRYDTVFETYCHWLQSNELEYRHGFLTTLREVACEPLNRAISAARRLLPL
jgi:hypothetical protein